MAIGARKEKLMEIFELRFKLKFVGKVKKKRNVVAGIYPPNNMIIRKNKYLYVIKANENN